MWIRFCHLDGLSAEGVYLCVVLSDADKNSRCTNGRDAFVLTYGLGKVVDMLGEMKIRNTTAVSTP